MQSRIAISLPALLLLMIQLGGISVLAEPAGLPKAAGGEGVKAMALQRWDPDTFHADYTAIVETLSASHGGEQTAVLLNAAELYLSHMLLFEASSILEEVTPEAPELRERHAQLRDAARLLQGMAIEDSSASALMAQDRPDAAFWRSLQGIASADFALLEASILDGFTGLGMQSRAVLRTMLPVFVEAAIEMGHRVHADAGLRLMAELPDLATAPVTLYLRAKAEERRGNESTALEGYFKAAEGWDQYAVRARLAIADMSMRNGGRGALLAAKSVLSEGAEAWRGGRYELEVLKRLARVSEAVDDDVGALLTLGRLLSRFPNEAEAAVARGSARRLLAEFYEQGSMRAYPIAGWMDAHLELLSFYRSEPAFAAHTEAFADYLLQLGATDLAMQEYRRALRLIRETGEPEAAQVKQQVFRLNLKIAEAQLRAGLAADARITLDVMSPGMGAAAKEAHAALRGRVLAEVGDHPALIAVTVKRPTPDHLRAVGRALMEKARWDQASDVLQQFWAEFPEAFNIDDATALLIASRRADDPETRARVVRSFPSLTPSQPLIELAQSLDAPREPVLPLKEGEAMQRLENLRKAFESINKTTSNP